MMQDFEKPSTMAKIWQKIEQKPCSTCLQSIFRLIPGTRPATIMGDYTKCTFTSRAKNHHFGKLFRYWVAKRISKKVDFRLFLPQDKNCTINDIFTHCVVDGGWWGWDTFDVVGTAIAASESERCGLPVNEIWYFYECKYL